MVATRDMPGTLHAEEERRLNSWAGSIAQHLCPEAPIATTPGGLRLGRKGSLTIAAGGQWYDHEAGKGDRDALSLIRHLHNCPTADAATWARTWLAEHPGDGEVAGDVAAEAAEAGERRAAFARHILDEADDPLGTPAETYLRSRGLEPPFPPSVRYMPDARLGEGAIVGILTERAGETVGVQLGYLDPAGRKSTAQPQRQLFLTESGEQAAFCIVVAEPAEAAVPLVICEGLEDALSIAQAGAVRAVIGIPGVGRLGRFDLPATADVVVFRDGDACDSPVATQIAAAVDRWVLAGTNIRITGTPAGEDANSLLQGCGPEELRRLVAEAAPAQLSFDADVVRLAALEPVQYERERTPAAKRHDIRVSFLDAAVKIARAEAEAVAAEENEDEAPYPEPVGDLQAVLDAALAELGRYVAAAEHDLAAAVLWAAHAHVVHNEQVRLPVTSKLAIQSPDRGCGKTTLLEVIGALVSRPETGSSIIAAAVFRLIESRRPTLLLDEADRVLRGGNDELIAVLNSSHRRSGSYVWRIEEVMGQRVPCKFSTWAAVAFAGIRELPATLQDRSIVVRLRRARPGEVQAHLRNGTSPALRLLKRKLIRWSQDLVGLPEPVLPAGLVNRAGDNWAVLFAIAAVAGGRWPQLVSEAAVAGLAADQQEGVLVALLDGIRRAFGERDRLRTRELLDFLFADGEHDWGTANRGKPINEAFLRECLRNVIAPAADGMPGSERWGSGNNKERGYSHSRFVDAWQRYLPPSTPPNHPAQAAHPAPPLKTNGNSWVGWRCSHPIHEKAPGPRQRCWAAC